MLDFTSALYLGFLHDSRELRPWSQFTMGMPAALGSPGTTERIAQEIAQLQGCERATLAASTLHVFWDLFRVIADPPPAIFLDRGTYPIARWGIERAAARGAPVRIFQHHDALSLQRALVQESAGRRRVIVADGYCPSCGRCVPVAEYLELAREYDAYLVLDDTQAFGILGHSSGPEAPYGRGGGGMLRKAQVGGREVVMVCSMAKAFGVPMAILSGSGEVVQQFEEQSETRIHCSPPSIASLHAAENALRRNREEGDAVRKHLAQLVHFFHKRLSEIGFAGTPSLFPIQSLPPAPALSIVEVHRSLLQSGIRGVLHRLRHNDYPRLSFLITARHTFHQLNSALDAISRIVRQTLRPVLHTR